MKAISLFTCILSCLLLAICFPCGAQKDTAVPWHGIQREIHYRPEGEDFVLANGRRRFNRALYGTNTAFRVEAGDLPEVALYMAGMGGNFKFGLVGTNTSKWLIDAKNIKAIYRPGSIIYEVRDTVLGTGCIQITVLALADAEGMIVRATFN